MAVAFSALRHRNYRKYMLGIVLSMMADSIEHVISYWVIFEKFHSPVLGGVAIISHWVPFLLFSFFAGSLADRLDCRRIIQASSALYMLASAAWAILFWTGTLSRWHTMAILIVHGMAGVFFDPANQLLVFDVVGPEDLPSAIRLTASCRQMAFLLGPAVGGALMLWLGPVGGLLVNVGLYLPLLVLLLVMPHTGHNHNGARVPVGKRPNLRQQVHLLREVTTDRRVLLLMLAAGCAAFFVGNGMQPQMPSYAKHFGANDGGFRYTVMLGANGAGAILGALALESGLAPRPSVRTTVFCATLWSLCILLFVLAPSYGVAVAILAVAGVLNIAYASMAQTLVQLLAPPALRGRVVGLLNMAQMGLRAGSGFTIGFLGSVVGVIWSLGLSAGLLLVILLVILWVARRDTTDARPRPVV